MSVIGKLNCKLVIMYRGYAIIFIIIYSYQIFLLFIAICAPYPRQGLMSFRLMVYLTHKCSLSSTEEIKAIHNVVCTSSWYNGSVMRTILKQNQGTLS